MKQNIYATYDTASGLYSHPLFAGSDGEIMREFSDLVQNAEHPIGKHPEDYSLFRMGTYDNIKGTFNDETNECLATGMETLALTRKTIKKDPEFSDMVKAQAEDYMDISPGGTD